MSGGRSRWRRATGNIWRMCEPVERTRCAKLQETKKGRKSEMKSLIRTALCGTVAACALAVLLTGATAEDPVAYAKKAVEAGRASKMSRAPLDQPGVVWTGAESSPPPIKGAKVAVMPCPLALVVC